MSRLGLALALLTGASTIAAADGIFPDCHTEEPCNTFSCNNMSSSPGCGCETSGATSRDTLSVGTSLAIVGFASFWVTRKRRRR